MQILPAETNERTPAVFHLESKTAALTPHNARSPDCFFTVQKRGHDEGNLLPTLQRRQEYFPHYPTFKHRVHWCHKRKWLWQQTSNHQLNAAEEQLWCRINSLSQMKGQDIFSTALFNTKCCFLNCSEMREDMLVTGWCWTRQES